MIVSRMADGSSASTVDRVGANQRGDALTKANPVLVGLSGPAKSLMRCLNATRLRTSVSARWAAALLG
jgi:hypothetical protein